MLTTYHEFPDSLKRVRVANVDVLAGIRLMEGELVVAKCPSGQLVFNVLANLVPGADTLVVFLPSARPTDREKWRMPYLSRWSWGQYLAASTIVIDDPTLNDTNLIGGWFHGTRASWGIEAAADIIRAIAFQQNIPLNRIILYGSSVGGFAALQISALIPESFAMVEVPQTDLVAYPREPIRELTEAVYGDIDFMSVTEEYPERFSVISHWRAKNTIPTCHIIHEASDIFLGNTQFWPFLAALSGVTSIIPATQRIILEISNRGTGHSALLAPEAIPKIKKAIEELPRENFVSVV